MSRCLGFTGIMSTKSIVEVFARADISASGRFASQNVNVKHQLKIGLVGFEPTACRRGDRSSAIDLVRRCGESGWWDLNPRPPGPEPGALPS